MLSCLLNPVQRQSVAKYDVPSGAKSTLSKVHVPQAQYSVTTSAAHSATEASPDVDKSSFLKQLGLVPAQSSGLEKQSRVIACNVIVIDDDEDDDQSPHPQDSCITDLFGTTRPLRGDREVNGNVTHRLLQPCSRLRKLLSIDVSSPLGSRTLQYVTSRLNSDGMPLNPYTVSHSLAGSDNALDYGTFCRTPVKGVLGGRLRQREFPVKYRHAAAGTHYHHYCFGRADRRRFCRRFDSGLSHRSYQLRQRLRRKYGRWSVATKRLTASEISDWRSSQHLLDEDVRWRRKMEERERAAAAVNMSHNAPSDDIITVSSDSEDEMSRFEKQELTFTCHHCRIKLKCGAGYRTLIRDHYKTCHGIVDIDIVGLEQLDGSVVMQIIHVPPTARQFAAASLGASSSVMCIAAAAPTVTVTPLSTGTSQQVTCSPSQPVSACQAQPARPSHSSGAGESTAADSRAVTTHTHSVSLLCTQTLPQPQHTIQPTVTVSGRVPLPPPPLPKKLVYSNAALLNGGVLCCGDSAAASLQSPCDADVICLD